LLGIREWRCYEYGPDTVSKLFYRGEPGRFGMRVALGQAEPQVELIKPLGGPSIYHDWLAGNVDGVHHVGFWVDSLERELAVLAASGFEVIQAGWGYGLEGDGNFAYLDTVRALGVVAELVELPRRRREPVEVFSFGV
jgi:methylmalonyl-CoA/ethylmalonyl-CoA epimerase